MDAIARVRTRFSHDRWSLFSQVPNCIGLHPMRIADAIAIGKDKDTSRDIHGFEFKATHSDWLNDVRDPSKSHAIKRYCDFWWLVAETQDVVRAGELPSDWGMLVHHGLSLRLTVDAPRLSPIALDRAFVASLARSIEKASPDPILTSYAVNAEERATPQRLAEVYARGFRDANAWAESSATRAR